MHTGTHAQSLNRRILAEKVRIYEQADNILRCLLPFFFVIQSCLSYVTQTMKNIFTRQTPGPFKC